MMARLNSVPHPSESPMDFAYDNGHGPVSADSPFLQNDVHNLPFKNGFAGQKRSSSELDSPTKPSLPALRKPEGQTYLFPSTPSAKTQPGFRAPSFTTPQRPIETDFSSGGEQSSPVNADSEDTPDPPPARMGKSTESRALVQFEGTKSAKKPSSSPLSRLRRQYTDVLARRVHKRRRRDADGDVRSASRRSSQEQHDNPGGQESGKKMGIIPSVLTFIDAHPSLPNTLSVYVQFMLNVFFAFCLMYVLYGIFTTIRHDIDEKAMIESSEILAEMGACAREFKDNRCERETRVPAMETVCNNWERCMQRDPYKVGRSRLSAGMFAEIFNSFIEPISLKAIVVSITVIVGCFAVNNLSFGFYRAKHHSQPHSSHPGAAGAPLPSMYMPPPPNQAQMTYPTPGNEGYYTPYHQHQHLGLQSPEGRGYALEAPEVGRGDGRGSPRKGGGYRNVT